MSLCIFCFGKPPIGLKCTYDLHCEMNTPPVKQVVQRKPFDTSVCITCKLHYKNPASATNGCEHSYPVEE